MDDNSLIDSFSIINKPHSNPLYKQDTLCHFRFGCRNRLNNLRNGSVQRHVRDCWIASNSVFIFCIACSFTSTSCLTSVLSRSNLFRSASSASRSVVIVTSFVPRESASTKADLIRENSLSHWAILSFSHGLSRSLSSVTVANNEEYTSCTSGGD